MLLIEGGNALGDVLGLAHDLDVGTDGDGIGGGLDVVEDQLAEGSSAVDSTGDPELLGAVDITGLTSRRGWLASA